MTAVRHEIKWSSPVTGALVIGGIFFSLATLLAWTGMSMRELENSIPSWAPAHGTLTKAGVVYDYVPKRNTPKQWQPEVRYRYTVNGVEYEGHLLLWGDESSADRETVEKNMARVLGNPYDTPLPRPLTVYYAPGDPQLAVLEAKNHSNSSYGAFALAGFCGWVGLLIVVQFIARARAGAAAPKR